jgi:hypothetical protein
MGYACQGQQAIVGWVDNQPVLHATHFKEDDAGEAPEACEGTFLHILASGDRAQQYRQLVGLAEADRPLSFLCGADAEGKRFCIRYDLRLWHTLCLKR